MIWDLMVVWFCYVVGEGVCFNLCFGGKIFLMVGDFIDVIVMVFCNQWDVVQSFGEFVVLFGDCLVIWLGGIDVVLNFN